MKDFLICVKAGIALDYGLDERGVRVPEGTGNIFHHRIQTVPEAHPASYSMDTGAISLEVKRPGHEADNSPASNAEVKE
jgi:hypothetical protein